MCLILYANRKDTIAANAGGLLDVYDVVTTIFLTLLIQSIPDHNDCKCEVELYCTNGHRNLPASSRVCPIRAKERNPEVNPTLGISNLEARKPVEAKYFSIITKIYAHNVAMPKKTRDEITQTDDITT